MIDRTPEEIIQRLVEIRKEQNQLAIEFEILLEWLYNKREDEKVKKR